MARPFEIIERLAAGKSFLDMGGMWRVHGEYAFRAERAGATRVVMVDGMDPTAEFDQKRQDRRSHVEYVQGDLHDPGTVDQLGSFEVVWCGGVIYHSPDPYRLIDHLRRLTTDSLILGTRVIPEVPGVEGGCVFYPALSEASRRTFAWLHGDAAPGLLGVSAPFDRTPMMAYANCWWGLSASAVVSMLDLARFEVLERYQPNPLSLVVVARATSGDPLVPPLEFSRTRGNRRAHDLDG